jgi:hypothetical protein
MDQVIIMHDTTGNGYIYTVLLRTTHGVSGPSFETYHFVVQVEAYNKKQVGTSDERNASCLH